MMIRTLHLHDFRNYEDKTFSFEKKNVVFCGPNGRGKTNILEAISLLSVGRSWRENEISDLIREGADNALLESEMEDGDQYRLTLTSRSRKLERNEKKRSFRSHLGKVPTLLFAPEFLTLFSATKRERQRFFDRFLFQLSGSYRDDLSRCNRAIKQKNVLLRTASQDRSQSSPRPILEVLSPWNEILAQSYPRVIAERKKLLADLRPILQRELNALSQKEDEIRLTLEWEEDFDPTQEGIRQWLQQFSSREQAAGRALIGPHRDDFGFFLRGRPLPSTASRGEERSVMLALLAAQKSMLQTQFDRHPILLLDDVFSELDQQRQDYLENLCNQSQIFFTTTHHEHFQNFSHPVQKFEIRD